MWTSPLIQLDLSRRRVAAISFLSNISVDDQPSGGDNLICLKDTKVLSDFRTRHCNSAKKPEAPKKQAKKSTTGVPLENLVISPQAKYATSNEQAVQSAPPIFSQNHLQPFKSILEEREPSHKSEELDDFQISSTESLHELHMGRKRTISGTHSDRSSNSYRELTFIKSIHEHQANGSDTRLMFTAKHGRIPFTITSVISWQKAQTRSTNRRQSLSRISLRGERDLTSRRLRQNSFSRPLSAINDLFDSKDFLFHDKTEEDTSYHHLLGTSYANRDNPNHHESLQPKMSVSSVMESRSFSPALPAADEPLDQQGALDKMYNGYSPYLLEGWLLVGQHRTFLPFPSYVTSIIDFVRPSEMKKELNKKFKERFPKLEITFTKLRSIKRELQKIAIEDCDLDVLTLAQSFVYFEQLVLKNRITKVNRKYCAGACLILAAKLNDVKGSSLTLLIEKIESVFRLNRKELLMAEFAVLVALEFALHVPTWQIFPHFQRLLYQDT